MGFDSVDEFVNFQSGTLSGFSVIFLAVCTDLAGSSPIILLHNWISWPSADFVAIVFVTLVGVTDLSDLALFSDGNDTSSSSGLIISTSCTEHLCLSLQKPFFRKLSFKLFLRRAP